MSKKFLCVCRDGNVRSVGLAYLLHNKHGQEAVPVGHRRLSATSMAWFCEWADYVVVMQEKYREHIPVEWQHKVQVLDVGRDRFKGQPFGEALQSLIRPVVEAWAAKGFEL